jgi:rubredoxin
MPLPSITRKRVCPKCGSKEVRRERRRGLYVRLVCLVWGVRAFRCSSCDQLFLARSGSKT